MRRLWTLDGELWRPRWGRRGFLCLAGMAAFGSMLPEVRSVHDAISPEWVTREVALDFLAGSNILGERFEIKILHGSPVFVRHGR